MSLVLTFVALSESDVGSRSAEGSRAGAVVHLVLAGLWSIRDQNCLGHLSSGQQGMLSRVIQSRAFKISK